MPHSRISSEEIVRRGEYLYAQRIRALVETEANIGKIVSIDIGQPEFTIEFVWIQNLQAR